MAKESASYSFNGVDFPTPDEDGVQYGHESLSASGSGRTQDGVMHNIFVRTNIRTRKFTYQVLTTSQHAALDSIIGTQGTYTGVAPDGETESFEAYIAKSSITRHSAATGKWYNFSFDVIEV